MLHVVCESRQQPSKGQNFLLGPSGQKPLQLRSPDFDARLGDLPPPRRQLQHAAPPVGLVLSPPDQSLAFEVLNLTRSRRPAAAGQIGEFTRPESARGQLVQDRERGCVEIESTLLAHLLCHLEASTCAMTENPAQGLIDLVQRLNVEGCLSQSQVSPWLCSCIG